MISFQGFKPSGMEKIANAMGFQGNIKDFQKFLDENPDRQTEMMRYQDIAREMAKGGVVKMQEGGTTPETNVKPNAPIADIAAERLSAPALPEAGVVNPVLTRDEAGTYVPPTTGQLTGERKAGTFFAETEKADATTQTPISTVEPEKVTPAVDDVVTTLEAAQSNPDDPRLKMEVCSLDLKSLKKAFCDFNFKSITGKSWVKWQETMESLNESRTNQKSF